jgi:hypothetical protein
MKDKNPALVMLGSIHGRQHGIVDLRETLVVLFIIVIIRLVRLVHPAFFGPYLVHFVDMDHLDKFVGMNHLFCNLGAKE